MTQLNALYMRCVLLCRHIISIDIICFLKSLTSYLWEILVLLFFDLTIEKYIFYVNH